MFQIETKNPVRRIRYRRGIRLPADAVYVGRPTKWGNPYKVGDKSFTVGRVHLDRPGGADRNDAVWAFRHALLWNLLPITVEDIQRELSGHDLACWCPLDNQPCHADVLIEICRTGRNPQMDPNALIIEGIEALDNWLSHGGFLPDAWMSPDE